jgi:hypothetical protein
MADIADNEFSVAPNGNIRYVTGSNHTVIELHRWLGKLMDDAQAAGDDILDITDATASERSTDNIITLKYPYNIDDTTAQKLYDGSIIQSNTTANLGEVIYDGILVFANAGMPLEIIQNGAIVSPNFWTTGLNADATNGISHRFILKVRTGGVDIDGRRLIGQTRQWGKTYSEFKIGGTARGNNVMALTYANDLNNDTEISTIAGYSDIINTAEGYSSIDVDNDGTPEYYYSKWDVASRSKNDFYERMKFLAGENTSATLYGLNGELFRGITHQIGVSSPTGLFNSPSEVMWSGGVGQLLAIDAPTSGTTMWIQLKTGTTPSNQLMSGSSGTIYTGTITERTLSFPFVGSSTGNAIIGAYGFGIESADLGANDLITDLTNTANQPPNNVTFSVGGLIAGEDRVLVAPATASGTLHTFQFNTKHILSSATVTQIQVSNLIYTDTPNVSGSTLRIECSTGIFRRVSYNSYASNYFTTESLDFSSDPALSGAQVFVSYIDKLASAATQSFTTVYNADRSLYIRVRDGAATPIKTFETTANLGAAGGTATAIRTPDT